MRVSETANILWSSPGITSTSKLVQVRSTAMVRTHEPDQSVFRSVLPEEIDWKPFPAFPPPARLAVVVGLPGDTPHFHWAKSGEYVSQVTGIGPLGLEYLDPHDDPRRQHHQAGSQ